MEKSELAKNILMTATPLVSAITEIFVKPKLADIAKGLKLKVNKIESIFEDKFNEYLTRSYEKYSIMNTIVFHNQQRLLKDLYIPLTLENTDQEQFTIDRFDKNFLPVYERILITDTAGMGKSTLLKKIFLSVIDEAVGIPILVELRRISKSKDIIQEIMDQINSISKDLDKDFILRLIQQGNFVFLFDGYDEIPTENRVEATEQIQKFINKAGKNLFILTSRPESALSAFGDFKGFSVKPLAKNQAFDLLRRYDGNGNLSKELIKKLQGKTYNNIDEFITNPLLVSLLFAAFEHKHTIPIKKHIFYRQVYDALFESHDLTKGDSFAREKFCKLDVDEFHRVLRHIGYNCLIKGKIEFTKDEILDLIKDAKTYVSGISFKESDLLKDLISTVPLFTIDGIYYKWSHKSLQEYFAAQFIFLDSKEKQRDILLKIYKHENAIKFINVLDLYYSIDYRSFSETIIYQLLEDFFIHLKKAYSGFRNKHKKERQLISYGYEFILLKEDFKQTTLHTDIWPRIRKCTAGKSDHWSLIISPTPDQAKLNYIKVPTKKKVQAHIMEFLYDKKENFVQFYGKNIIKLSGTINLDEENAYLVSDEKTSVLNSAKNFGITNEIIFFYNGTGFFTIDEKVALKYFNELKERKKDSIQDKLLDF